VPQAPSPKLGRRTIDVRSDGGDVSSDGGLLLLRQVEQRLGLLKAVAKVLPDPRESSSNVALGFVGERRMRVANFRIFVLNESERAGVLRHLIVAGDLSAYGLVNAVTHYSQDVEDYDRATEFEALGGKLIELSSREWEELAAAA
jgi:hypothetical protein